MKFVMVVVVMLLFVVCGVSLGVVDSKDVKGLVIVGLLLLYLGEVVFFGENVGGKGVIFVVVVVNDNGGVFG